MREIKFRAWDNRKMQVVDFNNLFVNRHHPSGTLYLRREMPFGDYHETKLMQFTGLYDKNGKEVYEGDIIKHRYHDDQQEILWDERILGYKLLPSESVLQKVDEDRGLFEIIGNRFEHPHLLEESK